MRSFIYILGFKLYAPPTLVLTSLLLLDLILCLTLVAVPSINLSKWLVSTLPVPPEPTSCSEKYFKELFKQAISSSNKIPSRQKDRFEESLAQEDAQASMGNISVHLALIPISLLPLLYSIYLLSSLSLLLLFYAFRAPPVDLYVQPTVRAYIKKRWALHFSILCLGVGGVIIGVLGQGVEIVTGSGRGGEMGRGDGGKVGKLEWVVANWPWGLALVLVGKVLEGFNVSLKDSAEALTYADNSQRKE